jgi:hypothetical protein
MENYKPKHIFDYIQPRKITIKRLSAGTIDDRLGWANEIRSEHTFEHLNIKIALVRDNSEIIDLQCILNLTFCFVLGITI